VPIIERYRRPATVTLARGLFFLGSGLGLCSALTLVLGARVVVSAFSYTAVQAALTPDQIEAIDHLVRAVLASSAVLAFALAVTMAVAAVGVGHGRPGARIGAVVVVVLSLCYGLGSASYTSLGQHGVDWSAVTAEPSAVVRARAGQAYADAMPGVLAGTTGGLTDLQAVSYLVGTTLLLAPASRPHFRRRPPPSR
jgi:hypothetical protein